VQVTSYALAESAPASEPAAESFSLFFHRIRTTHRVFCDAAIPKANDDAIEAQSDTPLIIALMTNDVDADAASLKVTDIKGVTHGSVTMNLDGTVTYTSEPGFVGTDTFTYSVTNAAGGTNSAKVLVRVGPQNSAPLMQDVQARVKRRGRRIVLTGATQDADKGQSQVMMVDWGDGTVQAFDRRRSGRFRQRHRYADAGTYTVRLIVMDEKVSWTGRSMELVL
jgi:PKD repeat protein